MVNYCTILVELQSVGMQPFQF